MVKQLTTQICVFFIHSSVSVHMMYLLKAVSRVKRVRENAPTQGFGEDFELKSIHVFKDL